MIKIITDSTSDISLELAKEMNIEIVPLIVRVDGNEYKDRVELSPEDFYKQLEEKDLTPSTSQPSPQDFLKVYEKAKEAGDEILVITLSSEVSGTYQSAMIAKELLEYNKIQVINSASATFGLRIIIEKALQLRDEGKTLEEIVAFLEDYKQKVHIFALVDTLEYFYKGGRLSKTSATVGTLLKFKPVVGIKDGKLELFANCRGTRKSISKIIELIHETGDIDLQEPVCIGYTGNSEGLDKFENLLKEEFHFENVIHGIVGPVIGSHAGPGGRIIAFVRK
ncbi:DegV family protein [Traorella massiliensis]|uniref:DegV family protein n=1 Tax=Traorella massiliensis TaxID=1903263 RepID=UPI0008F931AA|nr:DegV family protein [Traorella massiliensis]